MKKALIPALATLSLFITGCHDNSASRPDQEVVSQRFIHKYGYDVSPDEWQSNHYPGQVITTMRNGITITSTYEDGMLHGPSTMTHPHSETLESLNVFDRGTLVRKVNYDVKGLPDREEAYLSPSRIKVTSWYHTGSPRSIEEYDQDELIEGEYFTLSNESESRVVRGYGERISRNRDGLLVSRELIDEGHISLRETFHPNGTPYIVSPFAAGSVHGERRIYAPSGEPVSIENFRNGLLHGIATYYQNGVKYLEGNFRYGRKHGSERFFVDGTKLVEENQWHDGSRHGLSVVFLDGMTKKEWFYADERVSKEKYHDLCDQEEAIAIMNERATRR